MGDVVSLAAIRRSRLRRRDAPVSVGEKIALFTGIRIERWSAEAPERHDEPPKSGPGRTRRRRKA